MSQWFFDGLKANVLDICSNSKNILVYICASGPRARIVMKKLEFVNVTRLLYQFKDLKYLVLSVGDV